MSERGVSIIVMNYGEREFRRRKRGRAWPRARISPARPVYSIDLNSDVAFERAREYNEYVNIRRGARGTLSLVNTGVRVTGGVLSVSPSIGVGVVARHS